MPAKILLPVGTCYVRECIPEWGNGITRFPEKPQTGDRYISRDYLYTYGKFRSGIGWHPAVKDCNQKYYERILPEICGEKVHNLAYTFRGCAFMEEAPEIPDSIKNMRNSFSGCVRLKAAPKIPDGVQFMEETFRSCITLKCPPRIPESVKNMQSIFQDCSALAGTLVCDASFTEFSEWSQALLGTKIKTVSGNCDEYTREMLLYSRK